jgi:hypothetical protein
LGTKFAIFYFLFAGLSQTYDQNCVFDSLTHVKSGCYFDFF